MPDNHEQDHHVRAHRDPTRLLRGRAHSRSSRAFEEAEVGRLEEIAK